MPRYFIALPLPDEVRDRLVAIQPPAHPGMRILAREELHLTLHFLGDVAANDIDTLRAALATVKMSAFTIGINGVGMFPSERHAKVLWAGVEADEDLTALHRSIGSILSGAIGFRSEERPYSPHITLARLDEPALPDVFDRYLDENREFLVPSVRIDRFVLFSSRFVEDVPKYQEEAVFPLLPEPTFHLGQHVRVILKERNRTPHSGTIQRIIWHFKDQQYNYYLEEDGKNVAKRYFDSDLERMD